MVLLSALAWMDGGDAQEMVSLKRFHHQYYPDVVVYEEGALTAGEKAGLEARGHKLEPSPRSFGNMQVITWDRATGKVDAASDPRGGGEVTASPACASALAARAVKGRPPAENHAADRTRTGDAGFAAAVVDLQPQLEVAGLAAAVAVVGDRAAAERDRLREHRLHARVQAPDIGAPQRPRRAPRPDARPEQRLVGVDVAEGARRGAPSDGLPRPSCPCRRS